ncbi:MAG: M67 family metallopeptidase [Acidobacteria bacterium]|nr:M67 family metallopeptidase [Acidobacteriota bacterium]
MQSVIIKRSALEQITRHAAADFPRECCGLLLGTGNAIERAVPARNVKASRTRFLIDPQDHFAALRQARAAAQEIVGAYHSHPGSPPVPSATDLAEANDPTLIHLIVSPAAVPASAEGFGEARRSALRARRRPDPDIRAFRLAAGNFEMLQLVSVE